jgi:hypothetical protein
MTEQLFLKQFSQLPENLKQEVLDFFEFLLFKQQNKQAGKPQRGTQQKPEKKKPENAHQPAVDKAPLTELQRLLLEAPDMTDEEYTLIMAKRKALNQWN